MDAVACELSSCWRTKGGEFLNEGERGAKCWKKVAADGGSRLSHLVVSSCDARTSSRIVRMLSSIQPCTSEVAGRGQSGSLYGANTGAAATAAMEPRKAAGDVLRAEVSPNPP